MRKLYEKFEALGRHINRGLHQDMYRELVDLAALQRLVPLTRAYHPWSSFAMRPSAISLLINEVYLNGAMQIIECGVGLSTVYTLAATRGRGVRIIGIDDDANWIENIRHACIDEGFDEACYDFICAPIRPYSGSTEQSWYDVEVIQDFMNDHSISNVDLLVVDGPKNKLCEQARMPALPELRRFLNSDHLVVLDDIQRSSETAIAKSWAQSFDMNLRIEHDVGGVGLLRSKGSLKKMVIV
ncbi:class I SAM-dependent methyltransferase [Thiorhodococcus mannitoliphagus]|uniref:Class I SAM-dependent methyltransferase n=1 Tax=Thiorhodococcus mannitoliphagus TaxID=329406 RepID=A0A6P1DWQ6_9GAMM|nr:class I SAM-dependent methyltransferase [Thiorhodococcus mannitoliphagus]NEX22618.1 class I SAM-dependent methyltransferase [Thiorhodococcus mannitoliphagus]